MRLLDWDLYVTLDGHQLTGVGNDGITTPDLRHKSARIHLIKPEHRDDCHVELDHEKTLVHELLHCHFEGFCPKRNTMQYEIWEQSVEQLAKAFIAQDRKLT